MRFLITGNTGFIGSALVRKLSEYNEIVPYGLQTHNHYDYFLHFGSPSSNILFKDQSCIKDTVGGYIEVVEYCIKHRIKLIYPSSATVYNMETPYACTKAALEDITKAYGVESMAFRIFAGYGPGEGHKKDYASIVYQFIQQMMRDESPVIYGDGSQTRDFVFIDDIVNTIVENLDTVGYMDIGTGVDNSFNEVVRLINRELRKDIEPIYVDKPVKYVENTHCDNPLDNFVTLEEGIRKIC